MPKRRKMPRPQPPKRWTNSAAPISNIAFTGAPYREIRDGHEGVCGPVTLAHGDVNPNPYVRASVNAEAAEINRWSLDERRYRNIIAEARTDKEKRFLPYEPDAAPNPVKIQEAAEQARAESQAYADGLDAWLDRMAERGERPVPRGVQIKCDAHVQAWAKSRDSQVFRAQYPCWKP